MTSDNLLLPYNIPFTNGHSTK